jgi:hypothetical protein
MNGYSSKSPHFIGPQDNPPRPAKGRGLAFGGRSRLPDTHINYAPYPANGNLGNGKFHFFLYLNFAPIHKFAVLFPLQICYPSVIQ